MTISDRIFEKELPGEDSLRWKKFEEKFTAICKETGVEASYFIAGREVGGEDLSLRTGGADDQTEFLRMLLRFLDATVEPVTNIT